MSTSDSLSFLVINPNTTTEMTESLKPVVRSVLSANTTNANCDFFTAPASSQPGAFASINTPQESKSSAEYCIESLSKETLDQYDGILVACYSEHPLVGLLAAEIQKRGSSSTTPHRRKQYVTGIFEASVTTSLSLLSQFPPSSSPSAFGIVSTGHVWEEALSDGVNRLLGGNSSGVFAGVTTTGLNARELHELPDDQVKSKMADAAGALASRGNVKVICLGCAGMVGLDDAVRQGVYRILGEERGKEVKIVDGVASGIQWLIGAARLGY
ncbi:gamma-tubulin [Marasmius crinis-equi]|uniref:Gamma-tubulin n=1 Tax=Marasmius crinis-equi TaxID=585013 RepID=A0ABR3ET36_9AGAR